MKTYSLILLILTLYACSPTAYLKSTQSFERKINKKPEFANNFNGFAVFNPQTGKYLIEYNADRYFTPASNTKLFTFFTGLSVLGDSIPGLRYKYTGKDSLIIWGTGDPTFLHHFIKTDTVFRFLQSNKDKNIFISKSNDETVFYGAGWSWDDYNEYYSAENSAFPIYGNVHLISIDTLGSFNISPQYSMRFLKKDSTIRSKYHAFKRAFRNNQINYNIVRTGKSDSIEIPIMFCDSLFLKLLNDTLKTTIQYTDYADLAGSEILYSYPSDSLYKKMLQPSDNFLAEQIILMASDLLFDTLNTSRTLRFVKDSLLNFISNKPRWVDGSGLSRYNLFTPRSFVELLNYLYTHYPTDKLFNVLATGGKYGTMKHRFTQFEKPIFYGKTGTLSNNHNLSGYLITKKGRIFIFSFMMNHYLNTHKKMQRAMDKIITDLYKM
ncbi:MAG: D-alanyl-D-alanine carboxypeptidase [Bacteroidales bacterium]|nr:D-alanyl-D-alanine carboxypeptidase [Bacteroidales bacterium]